MYSFWFYWRSVVYNKKRLKSVLLFVIKYFLENVQIKTFSSLYFKIYKKNDIIRFYLMFIYFIEMFKRKIRKTFFPLRSKTPLL